MHRDGPIISEISKVRRQWTPTQVRDHIAALPIWKEPVEIRQKFGGLTNRTYFAYAGDRPRYAIRVGFDQFRTRQTSVIQCTLAAHELGIGPRLVYFEPNLSVTDFVAGTGLQLEQMKDPAIVRRIVDLMKVVHGGRRAVHETVSYWWPFDTVRRYMDSMEFGKEATGWKPSPWADRLPFYREVTDRLERGIGPFLPTFTHNDMAFVNMIVNPEGDIVLIDWDGGGFGHPLFDLGEMLMWAEADEPTCLMALQHYYGSLSADDMQQRLKEVHSFQTIAALRLVTEVLETDRDPFFHVTPVEYDEGMKEFFPGQTPQLIGLAEMMLPRFETLWKDYHHLFPA